MSFCKKRLQPFLPFTNHLSLSPSPPPAYKCLPVGSGIGLATATREPLRPPNVLESASVGRPPPPPLPPLPPRQALTAGFFEDMGEVVDGLRSCTESLGFESSDELRGLHQRSTSEPDPRPCTLSRAKRRGETERMRERKFPPPLTSLNDKGLPSYFLKPVRRDGRLELTEVRTERLEILRASRIDGRLRLDFIRDPEFEADDQETRTEDGINEVYEEAEEEEPTTDAIPRERFTAGGCHHSWGGHAEHDDLHMWRQRCVTIQ